MKIINTSSYIKIAQNMEQERYDFAAGKEKAQKMSIEQLLYTIRDLTEVIKIQEDSHKKGFNTPKLGYYWDEYFTYSEELNQRRKPNQDVKV